MTIGDWIQTAAVVAAVAASVVALVIASRDRANARKIAEEDRRVALDQAKLMFDLDVLVRLLQNHNRGGSTDALERAQLGAEALTLVGVIGPELLPELWGRKVGDDEKLKAHVADPEFPQWKKDAIEVQLAVNEVTRQIQQLRERS